MAWQSKVFSRLFTTVIREQKQSAYRGKNAWQKIKSMLPIFHKRKEPQPSSKTETEEMKKPVDSISKSPTITKPITKLPLTIEETQEKFKTVLKNTLDIREFPDNWKDMSLKDLGLRAKVLGEAMEVFGSRQSIPNRLISSLTDVSSAIEYFYSVGKAESVVVKGNPMKELFPGIREEDLPKNLQMENYMRSRDRRALRLKRIKEEWMQGLKDPKPDELS